MAPDPSPSNPRLPRGRSALTPDDRGRAHRQRLQEATVEVVTESGFADTRIRDICARAHVASRDLYAQYENKQELLLSTCDAIVDDACATVRGALRDAREPPADVEAAVAGVLVPLARRLAARPAHSTLILVDVFSAGAEGPPYRRALVSRLRSVLTEQLASVPDERRLSEPSVAVVAAGTLQAFENRVRSGRARSLPGVAAELAGWAAGYRTATPLPLPRPPRPSEPAPRAPLPRNTQRLPRQFVVPHQRDRILRAVFELTAREGYAGTTIPAIAAEAQISMRTFYQHFPSKHAAFTAAYDHAFGRLFTLTWEATSAHDDWAEAIRAGLGAWARFVEHETDLARFGSNDALTAGREAVEKIDDAYSSFAALFARGRPGDHSPSEIVAYATAGGIGGLVGCWIADGHAAAIDQLLPHLLYAALAPATGDEEALALSGLATAAA
jgi:AcrR family transcriptional regulator